MVQVKVPKELIILHLFTFVTVGQNLLFPCMRHKNGLWKLLMVIMLTFLS